jgi:hypothetical protein
LDQLGASEVLPVSALSLKAIETGSVQALASTLPGRLNRRAEPPVAVTADSDTVCFEADTWQPLLLARVEDALDELVGSAWRCAFSWT